jgi:membrane protein YdbS with pleckstrin-like domain
MVADADWFSPDASETVVWHGKPRVRRIIPQVVGAFFLTVVAIGGGVALFSSDLVGSDTVATVGLWGGVGVAVLAAVGWAALAYLRVQATDYVLTDRNVYKRTGVLSERVTRVGIDRIQNTTLRKDVTGNLFDYGTVLLSTAGGGGTALAITDLDNPEAFREELGPLLAASGGPGGDRYGDGEASGEAEAVLDAETVDAMLPEARRLRESAERTEANFES